MTLWEQFVELLCKLLFGLGSVVAIGATAVLVTFIICIVVIFIRSLLNGIRKDK